MKAPKTICPRCGIREKVSQKSGYCSECRAALCKERRLRMQGLTRPTCPLCGSSDIESGHHYCRKCSKMSKKARVVRMAAKRRSDRFAELRKEASKVNLAVLRRDGVISTPPPAPPPPKLELSDFVGRDSETSLFRHM